MGASTVYSCQDPSGMMAKSALVNGLKSAAQASTRQLNVPCVAEAVFSFTDNRTVLLLTSTANGGASTYPSLPEL